jgi:hypothetical protein
LRVRLLPRRRRTEILEARTRLSREGLFVEPTAAVAPVAAWRLFDEGAFAPAEIVVVPLTRARPQGADRRLTTASAVPPPARAPSGVVERLTA